MWKIMMEKQAAAEKPEPAAKGYSNGAPSEDKLISCLSAVKDNSVPSDVLISGNNRSSTTSLNQPNGGLAISELHTHGEDNTYDEVETTWLLKSDQNCEQEHLKFSSMASPVSRHMVPATLSGPSPAFRSYPCSESSFWGNSHDYGQTWVNSDFHGAHYSRMVLPLELTEEPVYVNAKQYHGILRRRQLRAKAELENKVAKVRKPYLHESRHLHAVRRARGCGGRFLSKKMLNNNADSSAATEKSHDCNASFPAETRISTGLSWGPAIPVSSENFHVSSAGCNQVKGLPLQEMQNKKDTNFQWGYHFHFQTQ